MEITSLSHAMQIHANLIKTGQQHPHNSFFYNTLLRSLSPPSLSLPLFLSMHTCASPKPDNFTYTFVIRACGKLKEIRIGKQVHSLIFKLGFDSDLYVCNSLIHMYSKFGDLGCALKMFDEMSERDVVSWTCLIDGFVDNGRSIEGLRLFCEMIECGFEPTDATIVSILKGCSDLGGLGFGTKVHEIVKKLGLDLKCNVSTALIDMYSKCGCIESARKIFVSVEKKDVFSWTAMIHGLASHGLYEDAIETFREMEDSGVKPDERTLTAVLAACRNAGLVEEGFAYLKDVSEKYGVEPNVQHYGCMVDLYVRSGRLQEAEDFIRGMRIEPDEVLWRDLIWGCKIYGDSDRAERLIKELDTRSSDSGSFVLISNLYASAGRWRDKANVRERMRKERILKPPGSSKIELNGTIHEFIARDSGHSELEEIYEKLNEMEERVRNEGYEPEVSEVLLEMDDDEKAFQLLHHSEKLAVAYGLIKTKPGCQIRIVKNLRSCEDCHSFMKLISKVYEREIIVRDRIRFHYFRDGSCSCGNHW